MTCYEELKARGLIAQVTNEEEISKMVNAGKAVFSMGLYPPAAPLPTPLPRTVSVKHLTLYLQRKSVQCLCHSDQCLLLLTCEEL